MPSTMAFWFPGVLGLAAVVSSIPSQYEDVTMFARAINDKCTAPEGTGTCRATSNCKGISYTTALCPYDPEDIQCCVEIQCSVPKVGSGFCRSVQDNGCDGGKFDSGNFCPGDQDIQCCVKNGSDSSAPERPPMRKSLCDASSYNELMFEDSITAFLASKGVQNPACFSWGDDGCGCSPNSPFGYNFLAPCKRHDFGYRNARKYGWWGTALKDKIDDNFKDDLYDVCKQFSGWRSFQGVECRRIADTYVGAVKRGGLVEETCIEAIF